MKTHLQSLTIAVFFSLLSGAAFAQTPYPSTVNFTGVGNGTNQTTTTTTTATYVPIPPITNAQGLGLEFTIKASGNGVTIATAGATADPNLTFTRNNTGVNISEIRIRSVASGSASGTSATLNAVGDPFSLTSLNLMLVAAGSRLLTFTGYREGVSVATQTQTFTSTGKTAIIFSAAFDNVDDIVITGFGTGTGSATAQGGIRIDDIIVDNAAPLLITDANAATNAVAENSANGTLVGLTAAATTTTTGNIALNKPVTVTSYEGGGSGTYNGAFAVDGIGTTGSRWSSDFSDPQTFMVDLGRNYNINQVKINWETAAGKNYTIQTSTDNVSYTNYATVTNNTVANGANTTPTILTYSNTAIGRYIRIVGTARTTGYGFSIWEFEAYGTIAETYSLTDNAGGRFAINATTGVVSVANGTLLDYETATSHNITVRATDGTTPVTQNLTINVTDVNDNTPVITSDGGGATAVVIVATGATAVTTVTATDADGTAANNTVTYSISGGANAALFTINSLTGGLVLNSAAVAGSYVVIIRASDGTNFDLQTITVTVAAVASTYAFSQPISFNTSTASMTGSVSNIPILVYIQEEALKAGNNCANNIQFPTSGSNGYDFAFTTTGGTAELPYEVESFTASTGTLLAWVLVPTLTNTTTNLTFYFGSKTPAHPGSFAKSTWPSEYKAVYHFSDATASGSTTTDATTNGHSGTTANMLAANRVGGKIGTAYTFDGSSQLVGADAVTITSSFTLSGWIKVSALNRDQKILTNQTSVGSSSGGYKLGVYTDNTVEGEAPQNNRSSTTPTPPILNATDWYYVQAVYDAAGNTLRSYVNGASSKLITTTGSPTSTSPLFIGVGEGGNTYYFNGTIDEPRVISAAKSSDWIKAEFLNQNSYTTFTNYATTITADPTLASAIGGSLVYTWTGSTNATTNTANNWNTPAAAGTTGLPPTNGTASLKIPNTTTKPTLSSSLSVYGVTVDPSSSINLGNFTLTVGCNVYNNGTISGTASGITFAGNYTPQLYTTATSANTAQFGNITINNTAASGQVKIMGGPIDLYNTLTLTSGSLFIDNTNSGALTLKSSGTVTARVAEITSTTRTITGNVTVERWFTGGAPSNRGWRLMSSPVNNTATVPSSASAMYNFTSLKTNLNITGSGTNFDASANNGPTILFYNTATKLFTWPSDPTITNRNIGSGFYFYFRGSRTGANKLVKSGSAYPAPEANVVGLQTGVLNQHLFTYTLSNANAGFNQVGNPYPSSISLPSGSGSGAGTPYIGTTGFVYTYASNANSVISQPLAVTIASGQGFFVKSNSATSSISFTESLKTATQPVGASLLLGKPMGTEAPMISLKMIQDSANYDITYVRFLDTYKKEYDEMEDADDLNGQAQNVFFSALTDDNHMVAIASKPIEKQKTSVFLSVNDNFSGLYSIEKMDLRGIPAVYDVWLIDHFKNDSLDLRANSVYKFNLDKTNPQTYGTSRFEVVIRKKNLPPYQLISFKGQRVANDVMLKWNTANEYDYTSFELQKSADGVTFETVRNIKSSSQGSYSFKDIYNDKGTANVYYRLKQTDINDVLTYSSVVIISTQGDGTFSIFPNPANNVIQYHLKDDIKGSVRLRIINTTGITVRSGTFTTSSGQQDISSLTPGTYTIEITDLTSKKLILTGKIIKL
ncbi:MAG: LamG-like jellyroll fold domain-containing protein [Mucilaginibacter sp.]|uniref:discoidin domain-containing protein n=1 Tax=Mucilaginibacter sp. TaxID=1882438 RepID=UPI0035685A95